MKTKKIQLTINRLKDNSAFSLIELSVVISVAATLAVGFLSWTQPSGTTNAVKAIESRETIKEVVQAIEAFRVDNGRLPCPADPLLREDGTRFSGTNLYGNDFGIEDLDTAETEIDGITTLGVDCPDNIGMVPVHSLGLDSSYMNDAWGHRLLYHVSDSLCGSDQGTAVVSTEASRLKGCSEIDYANRVGNITVNNTVRDLTNNAAYVLISHGPNGLGAFLPSGAQKSDASAGANEAENTDNDTTYIKTDTSANYDDIVFFKTRAQMERLSKGGTVHLLSITECNDNSTMLGSLTFADTSEFRENISDDKLGQGVSGEQVALSILYSMQASCIEYYGETTTTHGSETWNGPQCPGLGSCYDTTNDRCVCTSGDWGACASTCP